jgi:hypothetical protein
MSQSGPVRKRDLFFNLVCTLGVLALISPAGPIGKECQKLIPSIEHLRFLQERGGANSRDSNIRNATISTMKLLEVSQKDANIAWSRGGQEELTNFSTAAAANSGLCNN